MGDNKPDLLFFFYFSFCLCCHVMLCFWLCNEFLAGSFVFSIALPELKSSPDVLGSSDVPQFKP